MQLYVIASGRSNTCGPLQASNGEAKDVVAQAIHCALVVFATGRGRHCATNASNHMHLDTGNVSMQSSKYTYPDIKMFLFGNAFRLTFQFGKTEKTPKFHYDYLIGMHPSICIWTLDMSVCSQRNIRNLKFKMLLFRNTLRLSFHFRKKVKNPKSHHDYFAGMHLTICIWTLEKLVCSHQNIPILTLKMFLFRNTFRLTFQFRKKGKKRNAMMIISSGCI